MARNGVCAVGFWREDALVMDKEGGLFIDPAKVRYADYEGRHMHTRGPHPPDHAGRRHQLAEAIRRPRNLMVGTPAMIADSMQDLFESEACDGFVLTPTISPVMWEEFARMLTPELQRRGLLRTEYTGGTMRENLRS
jgi:alkanesulfonate monooxygenase SsuD/methylene tetrahydromethanopterin reductase-like flavin-dependent oxidoreductase (luciferase family)